jgi:hypothetical protein
MKLKTFSIVQNEKNIINILFVIKDNIYFFIQHIFFV